MRAAADRTLSLHQPDKLPPIDIEAIVELGYGLRITCIPGFKHEYGIDGSLNRDMDSILVDDTNMDLFPSRFRFTLAHELAHFVLHADVIRELDMDDIEKWKSVFAAQDEDAYSYMEYQANYFAGHLLVPTEALRVSWEEVVRMAHESGIDIRVLKETALDRAADRIAREYDVSEAVIIRRLLDENLFER